MGMIMNEVYEYLNPFLFAIKICKRTSITIFRLRDRLRKIFRLFWFLNSPEFCSLFEKWTHFFWRNIWSNCIKILTTLWRKNSTVSREPWNRTVTGFWKLTTGQRNCNFKIWWFDEKKALWNKNQHKYTITCLTHLTSTSSPSVPTAETWTSSPSIRPAKTSTSSPSIPPDKGEVFQVLPVKSWT